MRIFTGILVPVVATVLLAGSAFANGSSLSAAKGVRKAVVSSYDRVHKCRVVCKGSKPILEYVEDGLAYALDIPLAILSPITCPIVAPIMRKVDSDRDRTYSRYSSRR
jgi:hypothetical protein